MRFLVIGSNSFSGSHFVSSALREGYEVFGLSRSNEPNKVFLPYRWTDNLTKAKSLSKNKFEFFRANLNNDLDSIINFINELRPTHIVNFASQGMVAESWLNPLDWYNTNLLSQVAFHDQLRKCKFIEKYIHITTPEVYGSINEKWIKESNNFNPSTPYAVSRAACDMHLLSFYKAYDFPVVFTRAANVYGPGQQLYRIIPRTILSALTGKSMDLHGGGNSTRSFIHISDVISATLEISISAQPGTSWHISTLESITIKDLVKKICELTSIDFNSIVKITTDRLGKDQSYLLDSSSLRKEFGWTDKISLDDGLCDTLNWVNSNLETLSKLEWSYLHKL